MGRRMCVQARTWRFGTRCALRALDASCSLTTTFMGGSSVTSSSSCATLLLVALLCRAYLMRASTLWKVHLN
ncbi:hypothetical protein PENSPDRAFT_314475 [Peniophora sp. CONT]|nr:hypothetical protein PENSPDRAFT_314475 [Peniophora sp. CONT]